MKQTSNTVLEVGEEPLTAFRYLMAQRMTGIRFRKTNLLSYFRLDELFQNSWNLAN